MTEQPKPAAPKPGSRRGLILGGGAVVVVLLAVLGIKFWISPLGPGLEEPAAAQNTQIIATAVAQGTPLATAIAAILEPTANAASVDPAATQPPTPAVVQPTSDPNAEGECGGPALMNVLVLGSDTRTNDYTTGRADFIRAVRVDFENEAVRMLSIPRDLWVTLPGLSEHGIREARVNTAYSYGNYYNLPGGGPTLMANTLNQNLGLTFDHYLVVNFAAVEAGIDAIGGLDIDLPKDVDGTGQGLPYFKAGPNHMDGATLIEYIRIRYIDNDLYRIDRQNQVLLALRDKLLSPSLVPALPDLVAAMTDLIHTDMSPAQLSTLVCLGRRVPLDEFESMKIGATEVMPYTTDEGGQVLLPNFEAINLVLQAFLEPTGSQGN